LKLGYVDGLVLLSGADPAVGARIRDALASCLERVVARRGRVDTLAAAREALAGSRAHALLVASDALGELEPRRALALVAAMPARGGPELVAFERDGKMDERLLLFRADALARLRGFDALRDPDGALDRLLVPAAWLE
jgi:hypothetical protein